MITWASLRRVGHGAGVQIHGDPGGGGAVGIFLTHFSGLGPPDPREDVLDRPRAHGTYDFTSYFGPRIFDLEGVAIGTDEEDLVDRIENLGREFSIYGNQKRLTFQRLGRDYHEFCDVRMASFHAPIDVPGNVVEWSGQLIASDPRIYKIMEPTDPKTTSFASNALINNLGKGINAPIVMRMYGPADAGAGVRNSSLSVERSVTLAEDLTSSQYVEVDSHERTVKLNGVNYNAVLEPESWFWSLNPGRNRIHRFGGMNRVEIDWREARI